MDSKSLEQLKARRSNLDRSFKRHRVTEDGETYVQILDDYFRERFSVSLAGFKMDLISNPYAIIAVGAYGRREVFPKAEARILFIFKDRIPDGAVELIRDIVYPLWDLGYTVNHSTKTLKEAVAGATNDYGALSSLLDSRFICGISPLYSRLMTQVREKIVYRKKREILAFLYDRDVALHIKFQGPEYLLEPDLFFSPGGLADVNSIFSAAQIAWDTDDTGCLEKTGGLSADELKDLLESRDYIRNLIVFLQLSANGNRSRLIVDLQKDAARFFAYKNRGSEKAVDLFLSDLEKRKDMIHIIWKRLYGNLLPEKTAGDYFTENEMKTAVKWVVISKGFVKATSLSKLRKHPDLVFSILEESEANRLPVSLETLKIFHHFNEYAPKVFFDDPAIIERFETLLFAQTTSGLALDVLAETSLLFAFIPEFKEWAHKRKFSYQPSYPVLKHALLTLNRLKELVCKDSLSLDSISRENRSALHWAALLHMAMEDTAKSEKSSEKSVEKSRNTIRSVLIRFRKTPAFIKKVSGLIKLNNTMLRLLHGEDPWDDLALQPLLENLGSPFDLVLLHLLCLADLRAQASRCYSDFKETDLRQKIMACFNCKSWKIPSYMSENNQGANLKDFNTTVISENGPRVQLQKTENMRVLNLGFSSVIEPVLPALHALDLSGIDLYDLRLFPASNGWADLLIRVRAPKDTLFEMKKWAGFTACLKDILVERSAKIDTGSIKDSGAKTIENSEAKTDPATEVTVYHRPDLKKTVILMHSPSSAGSLCRIIKGLHDQGLSPFYIKKTCCEKDFCLVVHASDETNPDESILKEVIYDTCGS
ncbi:MAG: hypothetical protein WC799_07620 [Desulfobacteraceae bacterium]|jgi:[protein-PII] uridylyltransferase